MLPGANTPIERPGISTLGDVLPAEAVRELVAEAEADLDVEELRGLWLSWRGDAGGVRTGDGGQLPTPAAARGQCCFQ